MAREQAIAGVRLALQGRQDQAVAPLRRSIDLDPAVPTVHHDLGLTFLALGRMEEAIAAFQQAVRLNPKLASAHLHIGTSLDSLGRQWEAQCAYEAAVRIDPRLGPAQDRLGQLYSAQGRRAQAQAAFRAAGAVAATPARKTVFAARALVAGMALDEAESLLRGLIAEDPTCGEAHVVLGLIQEATGRSAEAADSFERGATLDPAMVAAWNHVAMNTRFTSAHQALIERITASLAHPGLTAPQRRAIHFALGKAYDDLRDAGTAMHHFDAANRIRGVAGNLARNLDRAALVRQTGHVIASSSPGYLGRRPDLATDDATPILIVGMPRSGTTLTEQIISSHPNVAAGGELTFWSDRNRAGQGILGAGATPATAHRLAGDYLRVLREISPDAARVTDKMPFNFAHIGLVLQLFPRATIVHCRRHPVDTCLSIYGTSFEGNFDFAWERSSLVFFYRQYQRLMAHWHEVLPPGRLIEVDYEQLVADPEPLTRHLIAACGLEWDNACLAPHRNQRHIATASLWQARQPIYRTSVERWKRYEPWLGALRDLLPDAPPGAPAGVSAC